MKACTARFIGTAALVGLASVPALAQRQPPTPEQRIERLERQLQQVQRQVFPRGAPAATAGFSDEPAASQSSVRNLDDRLTSLERQLTDVLRQAEENGNRTRNLEADIARLRTDQERRIAALEEAARAAATVAPPQDAIDSLTRPGDPSTKPRITETAPAKGTQATTTTADDEAEAAYDEGYQLWKAGRYDQAVTSLRAFVSAYPKHRRVSWANNLAGRALLDKGQPRAAAEVLLANYRSNPKGERAADSLFYLGQSLMKLNQPSQACKVYSELEAVFRGKLRDELQRLLPPAKAEAGCN